MALPLSGTDAEAKALTSNKIRSWSPAQLKKVVEQIYGEMSMIDNGTDTVIATVDTPVKVAGTTVAGEKHADITHTDNKLQYTGAETRRFRVDVSLSAQRATGTGNKCFQAFIAKNGTVETKSQQGNETIGDNYRPMSTAVIVQLATNDYIEIWMENCTDDEDFEVVNMHVSLVEIK